ncbi:hypothetical protein JYT75_00635 [Oceanicaulis sp. AH-315-P02]|nr:hypothetical protein [Robiginitomaculum sp.]MBN4047804.1 hypothetical protein [Oceanicaulis sp. AH-315-P02]
MRYQIIAILFLSLFVVTNANATEKDSEPTLQIPVELQSAFEKAEAAASSNQGVRFSYKFQHHSSGELMIEIAFNPALANGEQLQIIVPTEQSAPKRYAGLLAQKQQDDLQSDVEKTAHAAENIEAFMGLIGSPVQQSISENGNAIYLFPIAGEYIMPGGQLKADVAKHLSGEIELDAASGMIVRTKIFAPKSFKASRMVKIKAYSMQSEYQQAWLDGPLLETNMDVKVIAKVLVKSFNVEEVSRRYDIEKR